MRSTPWLGAALLAVSFTVGCDLLPHPNGECGDAPCTQGGDVEVSLVEGTTLERAREIADEHDCSAIELSERTFLRCGEICTAGADAEDEEARLQQTRDALADVEEVEDVYVGAVWLC